MDRRCLRLTLRNVGCVSRTIMRSGASRTIVIPKLELGNERISQFYKDNNELKFFFETPFRYFSQQDCILPGKAKIKISVYSENAPKIEQYFQIYWSGKWKDLESDMFKEIVISLV